MQANINFNLSNFLSDLTNVVIINSIQTDEVYETLQLPEFCEAHISKLCNYPSFVKRISQNFAITPVL